MKDILKRETGVHGERVTLKEYMNYHNDLIRED